MRADCVFCDIVAGRGPASVAYEDDHVLAIMDLRPINAGHVLVIPKVHCAYLSEVPETLWAHLCGVSKRVAQAIQSSGLRCEGINLFLAEGEAAGQDVFHCHLHVIPRFRGDPFRIDIDWSVRPARQELDAIAERIEGMIQERV